MMSAVPAVAGHVSGLECVCNLSVTEVVDISKAGVSWVGGLFSTCACSFKILILHMAFPHGLSIKVAQLLRWQLNTHKTTERESYQGFQLRSFKVFVCQCSLKGRQNKFSLWKGVRRKKNMPSLVHHRDEGIQGRTKSICLYFKEGQSTLCLKACRN